MVQQYEHEIEHMLVKIKTSVYSSGGFILGYLIKYQLAYKRGVIYKIPPVCNWILNQAAMVNEKTTLFLCMILSTTVVP